MTHIARILPFAFLPFSSEGFSNLGDLSSRHVPSSSEFSPFREFAITAAQRPRPTTLLRSALLDSFENIPENADLVLGMAIVAMACTPYVIGVFSPTAIQNFYVPVYGNEPEDPLMARKAEIRWKTMYASLGLTLTTLVFGEAFLFPGHGIMTVLRNCYIAWSLFYTSATIKIFVEDREEILDDDANLFGIQAWHLFVTVALWLDILIQPDNLLSINNLLS